MAADLESFEPFEAALAYLLLCIIIVGKKTIFLREKEIQIFI